MYFAKQIADKDPLRFVFPSGKSLRVSQWLLKLNTGVVVKDGREILLPKHALYFSKLRAPQPNRRAKKLRRLAE